MPCSTGIVSPSQKRVGHPIRSDDIEIVLRDTAAVLLYVYIPYPLY